MNRLTTLGLPFDMTVAASVYLDPEEYDIIPINWGVENLYKIKFEGWSVLKLQCDDEQLNEAVKIASATVNYFINIYKDTHAFSQPELVLNQDGIVEVRIFTMTKEEYNRRKGKQDS